MLAGTLTTPAAHSVAVGRGDLAGLQRIWNDWLRHGHSDGADVLAAAPGAVLGLLGAGLLKPAPIRAAGLPDWAQVGAVDPDPEQLIAELFAVQPARPIDLAGWTDTASWWGQVRAAIAAAANPPGNAETAWQTWERLDDRFRLWLRDAYGSSLLSTAPFAALHQVAPRLARRVEEGAKILLVVIDGLGFAQWHPLRRAAGLTVLDATGSLAMIPTLTSVSRQAIFAGALPRDFAEHIRTTRAEERRWRRFWTEQGVADRDISYTKDTRRRRRLDPGTARARRRCRSQRCRRHPAWSRRARRPAGRCRRRSLGAHRVPHESRWRRHPSRLRDMDHL